MGVMYFYIYSLDQWSLFWSVDVTRAGEGQLEIMVNKGNLQNSVEMERTGVYRISFTPEEAGRQFVNINFNEEELPGMSSVKPLTCVHKYLIELAVCLMLCKC